VKNPESHASSCNASGGTSSSGWVFGIQAHAGPILLYLPLGVSLVELLLVVPVAAFYMCYHMAGIIIAGSLNTVGYLLKTHLV
jgi:hypothetical protein